MASIYHSVSKDTILDPDYQSAFQFEDAKNCKHILDCAESNLPSLVKSKASLYTESIKLVCPRIFSITRKDGMTLLDQVSVETEQTTKNFLEIQSSIADDKIRDNLVQSQSGITHDLYPVKN